MNLLSNSVKFSQKGEIILRAKLLTTERRFEAEISDYCTLEFSVKDHGIGIPADVQPRIFTPFFQADSTLPIIPHVTYFL